MWKTVNLRPLYKCTLQQKATQDILKAFTYPVELLDLGEKAKLNHRGSHLLIDLIKTSNVREIKLGDCHLTKHDLERMRRFLVDEKSDDLIFQKNKQLGIEGALLIKAILKRKGAKRFAVADCDVTAAQFKYIFEGLQEMSAAEVDELNMRGNTIGSMGITQISQLLSKTNVKKLSLARSYVTAIHLKQLAEGINKMKGTMDLLDLRGNMIPKKDVEYFKKKVENKLIQVTIY